MAVFVQCCVCVIHSFLDFILTDFNTQLFSSPLPVIKSTSWYREVQATLNLLRRLEAVMFLQSVGTAIIDSAEGTVIGFADITAGLDGLFGKPDFQTCSTSRDGGEV